MRRIWRERESERWILRDDDVRIQTYVYRDGWRRIYERDRECLKQRTKNIEGEAVTLLNDRQTDRQTNGRLTNEREMCVNIFLKSLLNSIVVNNKQWHFSKCSFVRIFFHAKTNGQINLTRATYLNRTPDLEISQRMQLTQRHCSLACTVW